MEVMKHGQNEIITSIVTTTFDETHLHSVDRAKDIMSDAASTVEEARKIYSVAINDDEKGNIDQAIDNYINAAGRYLQAVKVLSESCNNGTRQRSGIETSESPSISPETDNVLASWKNRAKQILNRVEELKKVKREGQERSNQNLGKSSSAYELDVLVRSSLLTSGMFLPWSDEKANAYDFSPRQKFVDPDGMLELSDMQKAKFNRWARPDEVMGVGSSSAIKMIGSISPYTIKQHCVADCSFIAGLCISSAYENRREGRRLVSSLIYPQDSNGKPIYNPQGVYMVKLWLNGVARRVLVDDYLPVDSEGNLLCSHTVLLEENKSNLELWVPILEKAYMKMCGGYDFAGSNSGVDLFSLTGWRQSVWSP